MCSGQALAGSPSRGVLPDEYRDLERHGFDLYGFFAESSEVAS
jgi:hypothetical protein